jgi:SAM-dependent methyltransferase
MSLKRRHGSYYWDREASRLTEPVFQEQTARYKQKEYLQLISTWAPPGGEKRLLKTDLFEEAFGKDSLLDVIGPPAQTIGIDISREVAARARLALPVSPLLVADVCLLPFKTESFDLIVSSSTLDHLPSGSLPAAVKELRRVLRTGGCLILTLDSSHNPLHLLSHYLRKWAGGLYVERCYTSEEANAMLRECRFEVTDVTAIYHIPIGINFLAKKLEAIFGARSDRWIARAIAIFSRLGNFRTRFLTGRFIALRALKPHELS